ncbi:hypothetical protein Tco_1198327 [Tanacetum coccineum]
MSLEVSQAYGQAHVNRVALPVVEVKGKGSATDVQAAKSLLELHKPKKQHAESGSNSEKVGSNSKQSHVALAGPNPEYMHDVFLATNYPKQSTDGEPVPTATVVNATIVSTNTSISTTIA